MRKMSCTPVGTVSKRQFIFSRESVGAISIPLHVFQWKASGKPVLVHHKISEFSMLEITSEGGEV